MVNLPSPCFSLSSLFILSASLLPPRLPSSSLSSSPSRSSTLLNPLGGPFVELEADAGRGCDWTSSGRKTSFLADFDVRAGRASLGVWDAFAGVPWGAGVLGVEEEEMDRRRCKGRAERGFWKGSEDKGAVDEEDEEDEAAAVCVWKEPVAVAAIGRDMEPKERESIEGPGGRVGDTREEGVWPISDDGERSKRDAR